MSNILPGTTHVAIPFKVAEEDDVLDWVKRNAKGRVDVLAYQGDDLLDHQFILAVINRVCVSSIFQPSAEQLLDWEERVESIGETPLALFAFEDKDTAIMFKLTFGGR